MSKQAIDHLESALTYMEADWLIEYLRCRELSPEGRRGSKRKSDPITPLPAPQKQKKPRLMDLVQTDVEYLKSKRFPTWAHKLRGGDPPKVAVFMQQLEPDRLYTALEMETLLSRSGFDSASWALGMLQTATANNGYGFVLQRSGEHYCLNEDLITAHQRHFSTAPATTPAPVLPLKSCSVASSPS